MNVYIFLGTHFPEMIHCVTHLAAQIKAENPSILCLPEGIKGAPSDGLLVIQRYSAESVQWVFDPDSPQSAFLILDPRHPLIPQLEAVAEDLRKCLLEPSKIVTCVDMATGEKHAALLRWYDAAIYYSDIVLLGNRSTASKPFIRNFQKEYERKCYPCAFSLLKGKGIPAENALILGPDIRRVSQMFDLPEDTPDQPGMLIEASCDLDLEEREVDPFRQSDEKNENPPIRLPNVQPWIVENPNIE